MVNLESLGAEWLAIEVGALADEIQLMSPSKFNEKYRYLPESVSSIPGFLRFSVNPYMREIVDCFDVESPVREVNLKKGVQITYTTALESGLLYFMAHIKTRPLMYMTADKELADARVENNILPMLQQSGFADIIRSSDEGNKRKTGKTADHLQFEGGGYLVPFGAKSAAKYRTFSIAVLLKDEIDAWPDRVGKDGDPDALSDARCLGYWEQRKIFRGSTPLIKGLSKIESAYLRGDQRKYQVPCKACGFLQVLRWSTKDDVGGFKWDMEGAMLVLESVRYCCQNCGAEHFEHDKEQMFSETHGAKWVPTADPAELGIRSYHLPAFYSPVGMQPWSKCVGMYLEGFDPVEKKVRNIGKYQVFYNNVLAETFEILGTRVNFVAVSAHRRAEYRLGEIPNKYAAKWSGSHVMFLTCLVDVHKSNLAVMVMGWTRGARCYVVDYWRFEDEDCTERGSPVWGRLQEVIEETKYTADDGKKYPIAMTLIDAGYANDTVTGFCASYDERVYPILGRDRPGKSSRIKEFEEFKTQLGTWGYKVLVDHYKDRIAPVLRREWTEDAGKQREYHFNAPIDIPDKALKELTVETRREKRNEKGEVSYEWHRPGNARNELWDLLVYGHAAVEILAWLICIKSEKRETVDWDEFWDYLEEEKLYYSD